MGAVGVAGQNRAGSWPATLGRPTLWQFGMERRGQGNGQVGDWAPTAGGTAERTGEATAGAGQGQLGRKGGKMGERQKKKRNADRFL